MRFVVAIASVAAALYGASAPAPRFTDTDRRSKLARGFVDVDAVFERFAQQRGVPGMVWGVVIDGELGHLKTVGVSNRETKAPVSRSTVFRIASMTKSFTALAILKLRDEGKLSLDDPISKYIPEFARMQYPAGDAPVIRVRDLLTHSAGFPEDNPWGDRQLGESDETLDRWLKAGIPFSTQPGTAYEYSNYGFALLGRIISKVASVSYREYVEKQILLPLRMTASTLEPEAVPRDVRALGYGRRGNEYFEIPPPAHGSFGAMGGLLTSADDLAKYVAYQLSAFPPRDEAERGPVRRSSLREMQQLWRRGIFAVNRSGLAGPLQVTSGGYGYGLVISQNCTFEHIVGHGGGLPGFGSYMMWLPEYGVGMFAMANLTYAGPGGVMMEAFQALSKTGGLKRRSLPATPVLTSTRDAIARLWHRWDDAAFDKLAANNLAMDEPAELRRKTIERLKGEVGECRAETPVEPENLLRGKFRMACDKGSVDVWFTLAPTQPPTVQHLRFGLVKQPDAAMRSALEGVLSGSEKEAIRSAYGACKLGEVLSGDGRTSSRVRLDCERGAVELQARLENGKIVATEFNKPANATCVP